MKFSALSLGALALLAPRILSFPFINELKVDESDQAPPQGKGALPAKPPPFDAKEQYRSNKGKYRFIPPTSSDTRGPCPGLNAMANHGYLPRNGRGTIEQFTQACEYVYGMAPTLALFLSTFGAVLDGDGLSWSVGGKPHTGISGAHSNYESDASIIRGDLHQYGNSDDLQMAQFMAPNDKTANYNMEVMKKYRHTRFQESVSRNPVFFYAPFSGIEVTQAGFTFTYRFMSNKSEEAPEGVLDKNVLKNFYSIYEKDNGDLYWKPGWERIPDEWYTRNKADKYSALSLNEDILYMATETPAIITTGCNVAGVNSYDVIDSGEMSGGAYTAEMQKENPMCFATEYVRSTIAGGLLSGLPGLSKLTSAVDGITSELGGCTKFNKLDISKLKGCPGFSLYGGPTGDIVKGAKKDPPPKGEE